MYKYQKLLFFFCPECCRAISKKSFIQFGHKYLCSFLVAPSLEGIAGPPPPEKAQVAHIIWGSLEVIENFIDSRTYKKKLVKTLNKWLMHFNFTCRIILQLCFKFVFLCGISLSLHVYILYSKYRHLKLPPVERCTAPMEDQVFRFGNPRSKVAVPKPCVPWPDTSFPWADLRCSATGSE